MSSIILLITTIVLQAQPSGSLPRITHLYLWQQANWKLSHDVLMDYNERGNIISMVYRNVAGDSTSNDVFEFDIHENMTFHGFYAKQNGSWKLITGERFDLQYDSADHIVFHNDERFNGTEWESNGRFTLTYHASGKMETRTNEIVFNGNWLPTVRIVVLFDSITQKPYQGLFQVFRNGEWTNEERMLSFEGELTEKPNLTNYTMQQWLNEEWVNLEKQVTTGSNRKTVEVLRWVDSAWTGVRKTIDERDWHDNPLFEEVNIFENGQYRLENRNRHQLTYVGNDLAEDIIETYDPADNLWIKSTKLVYEVFVHPTGVEQQSKEATQITCYPNPAQSTILVTIPELTNGMELEVWTITGENIRKIPVQSTETIIDLRDVPEGLYIIKVGAQHYRIVKQ